MQTRTPGSSPSVIVGIVVGLESLLMHGHSKTGLTRGTWPARSTTRTYGVTPPGPDPWGGRAPYKLGMQYCSNAVTTAACDCQSPQHRRRTHVSGHRPGEPEARHREDHVSSLAGARLPRGRLAHTAGRRRPGGISPGMVRPRRRVPVPDHRHALEGAAPPRAGDREV